LLFTSNIVVLTHEIIKILSLRCIYGISILILHTRDLGLHGLEESITLLLCTSFLKLFESLLALLIQLTLFLLLLLAFSFGLLFFMRVAHITKTILICNPFLLFTV